MTESFTIPSEHIEAFRRIYPYIEGPLKQNQQFMEALLLFLKLGGEKLARIAIDAYNANQRLIDAETKKQLATEALSGENIEDGAEEELDEDDVKVSDEDRDDSDYD